MTTTARIINADCRPAGVYWLRCEAFSGETWDFAVRAESLSAAQVFMVRVFDGASVAIRNQTELPTHGTAERPTGFARPRWEFDATKPGNEQWINYVNRIRPYGVMGETIQLAKEKA